MTGSAVEYVSVISLNERGIYINIETVFENVFTSNKQIIFYLFLVLFYSYGYISFSLHLLEPVYTTDSIYLRVQLSSELLRFVLSPLCGILGTKNTTFRKPDLCPSSDVGGKVPTQFGPLNRAILNHWTSN
jgi:hypothetical protein